MDPKPPLAELNGFLLAASWLGFPPRPLKKPPPLPAFPDPNTLPLEEDDCWKTKGTGSREDERPRKRAGPGQRAGAHSCADGTSEGALVSAGAGVPTTREEAQLWMGRLPTITRSQLFYTASSLETSLVVGRSPNSSPALLPGAGKPNPWEIPKCEGLNTFLGYDGQHLFSFILCLAELISNRLSVIYTVFSPNLCSFIS